MKKKQYSAKMMLFLFIALAGGCVSGTRLTTEDIGVVGIKGTYDLYLYGCRYPSDIENVAILTAADAPYPLEINAFRSRYKVKKGLTAEAALAEANAFIRCGMKSVWKGQLRRIVDDRGRTFGYDVRPLYMPYEIRDVDVLRINYLLNVGRVTVYIDLAPGAEDDDGFLNNRTNLQRR